MSTVSKYHVFDGDSVVENGNKFLVGNGYLGYRGTLDEFGKAECVGLNIAGVYDGVKGKWRITLECDRLVNMARRNNLCSRVRLTADKDTEVVLKVGVDTDIWELNGPHLTDVKTRVDGNVITASAKTQESGLPVKTVCRYSLPLANYVDGFAEIHVSLRGGKTVALDRVAFVLCGDDRAENIEYDDAMAEHTTAWEKLWRACRVTLDGDERGQLCCRSI